MNRKTSRKRSKGLVLLLLPALIFVGIIGWLIFTLGTPQRTKQKNQNEMPKTEKEDPVSFIPIVFEEQQEIIRE